MRTNPGNQFEFIFIVYINLLNLGVPEAVICDKLCQAENIINSMQRSCDGIVFHIHNIDCFAYSEGLSNKSVGNNNKGTVSASSWNNIAFFIQEITLSVAVKYPDKRCFLV